MPRNDLTATSNQFTATSRAKSALPRKLRRDIDLIFEREANHGRKWFDEVMALGGLCDLWMLCETSTDRKAVLTQILEHATSFLARHNCYFTDLSSLVHVDIYVNKTRQIP